MPNNIIRNHNDPNNATTLNGKRVVREQRIFVPTHREWYPVLQTSMHFCFRDASAPRGSTLFCTCGSAAGIFGYNAYQKYTSWLGREVIACISFIQTGVHSDGSHE